MTQNRPTHGDALAALPIDILLCALLVLTMAATAQAEFRVMPYLQAPAPDGMSLIWFGEDPVAGKLVVKGEGVTGGGDHVSNPVLAEALTHHEGELRLLPGGVAPGAPYLHRSRTSCDDRRQRNVSLGGAALRCL